MEGQIRTEGYEGYFGEARLTEAFSVIGFALMG